MLRRVMLLTLPHRNSKDSDIGIFVTGRTNQKIQSRHGLYCYSVHSKFRENLSLGSNAINEE
jgi:hypothetical protein